MEVFHLSDGATNPRPNPSLDKATLEQQLLEVRSNRDTAFVNYHRLNGAEAVLLNLLAACDESKPAPEPQESPAQ